MMKRLFSVMAALAVCFCLLPSCVLKADAAKNYHVDFNGDSSRSMLVDERGIFIEHNEDYVELNKMIQEYSEKLDMNILVFTAGTPRNDLNTEIFAQDSYDEIFGEDTDGIFYYLDISGQYSLYDYITVSGESILRYKSHLDSILYALSSYLPASGEEVHEEDICEAIKVFLKQLEKYSDHTPKAFEYYYDEITDKYCYYSGGEFKITKSKPLVLYIKPFCISLVSSFVIMLIVYFSIKSKYKFKSTTNPSVYISTNSSRFTQRSDMLVKTYTNKTKIQSSSGGSGHRSGGGGRSHSGAHAGSGRHR